MCIDDEIEKILAMMKSPDEANRNIALMMLVGKEASFIRAFLRKYVDVIWALSESFFSCEEHTSKVIFFSNRFCIKVKWFLSTTVDDGVIAPFIDVVLLFNDFTGNRAIKYLAGSRVKGDFWLGERKCNRFKELILQSSETKQQNLFNKQEY